MNNIPENAIKVFKFVTKDFRSPGGWRKIDYSGPYPTTITEEYCAPKEAGQCAAGIHVVPMTKNIDWTNVIFDKKIIAGYVMPEDVIFMEGNGKMRVRKFTVTHTLKYRNILKYVIETPGSAYMFADASKRRSIITRFFASKDPEYAYKYACTVDRRPSFITRNSACKCPDEAFNYAMYVDFSPTRKTRKAASKSSTYAVMYGVEVDKKPHRDTRTGACQEPDCAFKYAKLVDKSPHKETWRAVRNTNFSAKYATVFKTTEEELDLKFHQ